VTPADIDRLVVRRAEDRDGPGLGDVWLTAWYATFDFPPSHPDDEVRQWLATEMAPTHETWVAVDPSVNERVVALLALSDSMVDQLYVAPDWIGHGLGGRLLELAKSRRPDGLDLYCFAINGYARRFYEARGFDAVAFGDGSGNEERQPDVLYRWRPVDRHPDGRHPPDVAASPD
jgi:GNAT superfamily N-acetyltransferase